MCLEACCFLQPSFDLEIILHKQKNNPNKTNPQKKERSGSVLPRSFLLIRFDQTNFVRNVYSKKPDLQKMSFQKTWLISSDTTSYDNVLRQVIFSDTPQHSLSDFVLTLDLLWKKGRFTIYDRYLLFEGPEFPEQVPESVSLVPLCTQNFLPQS